MVTDGTCSCGTVVVCCLEEAFEVGECFFAAGFGSPIAAW